MISANHLASVYECESRLWQLITNLKGRICDANLEGKEMEEISLEIASIDGYINVLSGISSDAIFQRLQSLSSNLKDKLADQRRKRGSGGKARRTGRGSQPTSGNTQRATSSHPYKTRLRSPRSRKPARSLTLSQPFTHKIGAYLAESLVSACLY
jgi:hypothetical protein